MKTIFKTPTKRGSALLIVLGFLSFMMISAVSFAVYMRIERQASSNYSHTIMARHLLNSALYRAMDEIDSDLRNVKDQNSISYNLYKFPTNWTGRVRVSAVEDPGDNIKDARVLSLEALSFVPGILVNGVRRYAVKETGDSSHMGAKWRKLSMPVRSLGDESGEAVSADGEAVIGRYAYVCVNVSDMLNVNGCKANLRDAETNRVSIGNLFPDTPATLRKAFDQQYTDTDKKYETLQDFYACMKAHNDTTFGSPYHEWIGQAGSTAGNKFNTAKKHVLMADGLVKAEPVESGACNITDDQYKNNLEKAVDAYATKLASIPTLSTGNADIDKNHFYCLLMDYLDKDNSPYWKSGMGVGALYRPAVEMVPMVYQIVPTLANLAPVIVSETTGAPGNEVTTVKLQLADPAKSGGQISVIMQTMFPFKNWDKRKSAHPSDFIFSLDAQAYLVAVKSEGDLMTQDSTLMSLSGALCFPLTFNAGNSTLDPLPSSQDGLITPCVATFNVPNCTVDLYTKDSGGAVTWANGFVAGDKIRVALVVFAGVKNNAGVFVDMVPGFWNPLNGAPNDFNTAISQLGGQAISDRLFFQTTAMPLAVGMAPTAYSFEWTSLEVPDVRFNHKASNWVTGAKTAPDTTFDQTLAKNVVGQEGRDSDVYMFVGNNEKLFSPGEFGFLIRPVADADNPAKNIALKSNDNSSKTEDYKYMYRTVRLYDHGDHADINKKSDDIYKYFYAARSDGTVSGTRVNPLSDIPVILQAAIQNIPFDYYWATQTDQTGFQFNEKWDTKTWFTTDTDPNTFVSAWTKQFNLARANINASWANRLSGTYGDWNYFKWYSGGNPKDIFGITLDKELNEIDRKMLMSYSLESFSDRQQLFLYILRAEATPPGLGSTTEKGVGQSLAGGRAVALVWRDPYPVNYKTANNAGDQNCRADGNKYNNDYSSWSSFGEVGSPWQQYPLSSAAKRTTYLHDQRILFFKQLEN